MGLSMKYLQLLFAIISFLVPEDLQDYVSNLEKLEEESSDLAALRCQRIFTIKGSNFEFLIFGGSLHNKIFPTQGSKGVKRFALQT